MHRRVANVLALGLLTVTCTAPTPSPLPSGAAPTQAADFEIDVAQFTETGGCGDVFFWATNAAGTVALTVEWGGPASEAWANGPHTDSQRLPHPEITVSVVEGNQLTSYYCNDVRGPGQGPTSTIQATSGTVEVAVRPNREGFEPAGQADLRLSDVTFNLTLGSGETWLLNELVIENVSVGWFAG